MNNHLSIKTTSIEFSVSGDTVFVEKSYEAVRELILERFIESTRMEMFPEIPAADISEVISEPMPDQSEELDHISFIECNDVYLKVYFVTREELSQTIFSESIDFDAIQNVYVGSGENPAFDEHITLGKALWRELTTAGRAAIRNAQ